MSGAIALVLLVVSGGLYLLGRWFGRSMRRRRPRLPAPDRAARRDCFDPTPLPPRR